MRNIVLLITLLASFNALAQKKKKVDYDAYWKSQEVNEQFEKLSETAHQQFQQGELEKAKITYQEALALKPEDQRTQAKIKDIKILLEKRAEAAKSKKMAEPTPVEEESPLVEISQPEVIESIQEEPTAPLPTEEIADDPVDSIPSEVRKTPSPAKPKTAPSAEAPIKPVEKHTVKEDNSKPYKSSANYRKYLAVMYPSGWTEETKEEGNKTITTLVYVQENEGDEYKRVAHNYGAVFYFKNGESISYGTWVAETKSFKQ